MKMRSMLVGMLVTMTQCFASAVHAGKPAPKPIEVSATTADSTVLSADLYLPWDTGQARFPLVILMHMMNRDRRTYRDLVPLLLGRRWAVLNVDLRGHGKSNVVHGAKRKPEQLQESDFQQMPADLGLLVTTASRRSARLDTLRVGVVGASIGSSVAVFYGAEHPHTEGIVLLSPGLNYRNMELRPKFMQYSRRPVLILVGKQDQGSFESCMLLDNVAQGDKKLVVYPGAEHGTDIFRAVNGADTLVANWLGGRL